MKICMAKFSKYKSLIDMKIKFCICSEWNRFLEVYKKLLFWKTHSKTKKSLLLTTKSIQGAVLIPIFY